MRTPSVSSSTITIVNFLHHHTKFRSLCFRVTEFQSKEILQQRSLTAKKSHSNSKEVPQQQQRSHTAKKSHSQEVTQQRSLTAKPHSKEASQQRSLTAKKSHSKRSLTAKESHSKEASQKKVHLSVFGEGLARKLRFHNFTFHFEGSQVSHASLVISQVSHASLVFTSSTLAL